MPKRSVRTKAARRLESAVEPKRPALVAVSPPDDAGARDAAALRRRQAGVYFITLISIFNMVAIMGSKVLMALYAADLGADIFHVGLLAALYAVLPLVFAVYAGKVSDRFGTRLPMVLGSFGLALGLLVPALTGQLSWLYVSPLLISLSFIFFHVSTQNLVGSLSDANTRVRNFGVYSLAPAVSGFVGALIAGFGIDHLGARLSFVLLASLALICGVFLLRYWNALPSQPKTQEPARNHRVMDLVANPGLRRAFIASGVTLAGVELFTFYFPLYGRSIGLSASVIGMIVSMQAAAFFVVRALMPWLVKRASEEKVLTYSLCLAGATYLLIPLFQDAVVLALIAFSLGLSLGCGQPLSTILTYNRAPAGRSGEALGVRITANRLVEVVIPLVFGAVGATFGLWPVFWANSMFLLVGGSLTTSSPIAPILERRKSKGIAVIHDRRKRSK
jgi:MFS family permease